MLRRILHVLLLLLALALLASQPVACTPKRATSEQSAAEKAECTVYVTRTGKRYHKEGCSSLRASRIPMSRKEAQQRGHTPCQRCGGSDCE